MSNETFEYQPPQRAFIAGFWRPEKGDVLEGIIVERAEGPNSEYLVVRATKKVKVISRDRQTGEQIERTAAPGREVGLSYSAALRGIEAHAGRHLTLTYLGKKTEKGDRESITRHCYKIEISHKIHDVKLVPKSVEPAPNGRRNGRSFPAAAPADGTKDDIDF